MNVHSSVMGAAVRVGPREMSLIDRYNSPMVRVPMLLPQRIYPGPEELLTKTG